MLAVQRQKQRLDSIFALVDKLPYEEEILSHWARYLCVITSGFFETALRILLSEYSDARANPNIAKFAKHNIRRITNMNEEKVAQILGSFSDDWCKSFEKNLSDEQKGAIDSIYANRNSIAHGDQVGITIARVKEYHGHLIQVIQWIHDDCVCSSTR